MSRVSAHDALRYATENDTITLLAIIVGGWALLTIDTFALADYGFELMFVLGIVASPVGVPTMFVGVVGLVYKLLVGNRRAVSE